MAEVMLSDLPAEAQELLKGMSSRNLELLACQIRGQQLDERIAAFPTDAEAAAKGARAALRRDVLLTVEEPLDAFVSLFEVLREALAKGASDDLDRTDCMHLWKVSDIADDLLRAHVAAVQEAELRLRAFTHPLSETK
jgi:hypothetical protein